MTLEQNIAARQAADEVWNLAMDEAMQFQDEACLRFYRRLAQHVFDVLPEQYRPKQLVETSTIPMTRDEAVEFGDQKMTFGRYDGTPVRDVPLEYLLWLDANSFHRDIHRYLASRTIQNEIGGDHDD